MVTITLRYLLYDEELGVSKLPKHHIVIKEWSCGLNPAD